MFCEKCGNPIGAEDNVCTRCGAPIEKAQKATSGTTGGSKVSFNFGNITKDSFSTYDIIMAVAALITIIGTFLPALTLSGDGRSMSFSLVGGGDIMGMVSIFSGNGFFILLLSLVSAALCLSNLYCSKNLAKIAWIPMVLNVVFIIVFFSDVSSITSLIGSQASELVSYGFGVYMVIAGTAANLILPFTPLAGEKKFDLQNMKGNFDF